jgi:HopA1 effector protein family
MNQYSHQLNHRVSGLDLTFAGSLHQNNCGEGYWDSDWCIMTEVETGKLLLQKNHLTLQADPQRHLQADRPWNIGDRVNLKLPKNLVEGDRYVAVGNAGLPEDDCYQIPFALDIETVVSLMQHVTFELNQMNLPFTLACFYDPLDYPHDEAAILTINAIDRSIAEAIVSTSKS